MSGPVAVDKKIQPADSSRCPIMQIDADEPHRRKDAALILRVLFGTLLACILSLASAFAQSPLERCAEQFIGSNPSNAPTIGGSQPADPFATNLHLCYSAGDSTFFATEYWPEQFAPRWAAYRLDPDHYGSDGCKTYTRDKGNCYVTAKSWEDFLECDDAPDPFHPDHMLDGQKLGPNDFSSTGHDRGHIAPRQAFSWHVCGAYQTFTMVNMSPQRAFLNQDIWASLEEQVLTWAVDEGPLYVVTGAVFRRFPHQRFEAYTNGTFDGAHIYPRATPMLDIVTQHNINFSTPPGGHILKPKRNADPAKVSNKVQNLRMPTGYYKVIYREAAGNEPAHAIGFLIPHTFENINDIPNVPRKQAFWAFVARIDLIEETSGTRFPGIPDNIKPLWGDSFFLSRRTGRQIRASSCGIGTPMGVVEDSTKEERIAQCTPMVN